VKYVYDASTSQWSPAADMLTARAFHTATLLNSGQVLVTGGLTFDYAILSTCELYDPITNK